ncbi:hypothetical protein SOASR030_21620 [Leminorella grimontii]|uniref:Sel1 repeat family protein n=1 Tax=Leminorella grimontii TaxID=82981 RepID=A0AAV5N252_9GAMM|nr:tetratricopeptide repeat protein [Leminorella grimontii]KFC96904.1 hypothetical protein GLGR_0904 [Leminorella grimontii ATCC 33999 = DSM 5078]GKX56050.1 hypothetical protein SOASR030_21620 [Leminorella grimontii]VFS57784.1 Polar organelle development protein [Leminorella grimontii]
MKLRSYRFIGLLSVLALMGCETLKPTAPGQDEFAFSAQGNAVQQGMLSGLQGYLVQLQAQSNDGDLISQRRLGELLNASGQEHQGKALLLKAANGGDLDLQVRQGDEDFSRADYAKAFSWYSKAAERGNGHAQSQLAYLYLNGLGTVKSLSQAVYWDRLAAEKGIARSQNNLGAAYTRGEGIEKSPAQAFYWYSKAAEQGTTEAQFNLAGSYYLGHGVAKNDELSYVWYSCVAHGDDEKLAARAKEMMKKIAPELKQMGKYASSQRLAEEYMGKYGERS